MLLVITIDRVFGTSNMSCSGGPPSRSLLKRDTPQTQQCTYNKKRIKILSCLPGQRVEIRSPNETMSQAQMR